MTSILIIPSWYPTPNFPLKGSFFQEQAKFLDDLEGFSIKVLFGEKRSYPLLKWFFVWLLSFFKTSWPISKKRIQQSPEAFSFILPANRRVPETIQIQFEKRLFWKAYKSVGWVPNLIHAQSGMDAGIYAHHLSKLTGLPFLILEHQVFVFHYYSKLRSTLIMNSFEAAKKTAAVSFDEKRQILMNQPKCNPFVIPNLVNEFNFKIKNHIRNSTLQIVTFMYSNPVKGYENFFISMDLLNKSHFKFEFTVVGNGSINGINEFETICKRLNIFTIGKFLPMVEREEVPEFLKSFDLYICSSDFESFGVAPREAMMCGLPVVTTANGGVEDCISHETGLIVPVRDPNALANAVWDISKNYEKFYPKKIREFAIKQFGTKVFLKAMIDFYGIK